MLTTLIPQLTTLIVTVRRNMLSSLATTFMILIIIVVWSARGNIATFMHKNPSAEQTAERAERSVRSDSKIKAVLDRDLNGLKSDRMIIRQFFNQVDPVNQMVIPSVITSYIRVAPGITTPVDVTAPMPRAYLSDVTDRIWSSAHAPRCITIDIDAIRDPVYHRKLADAGMQIMYVCPITDIDNEPLGIIISAYVTKTKEHPVEEVQYRVLTDTATKIAGFLSDINLKTTDPWWKKKVDELSKINQTK